MVVVIGQGGYLAHQVCKYHVGRNAAKLRILKNNQNVAQTSPIASTANDSQRKTARCLIALGRQLFIDCSHGAKPPLGIGTTMTNPCERVWSTGCVN